MESSSLGIIRTPNRANSEGPVPPPRNSMEDADSSITRKRPRLDSGDRAYRSMSADGKPSAELGAEPGKLLPSSQAGDQTQNSGNNLRDISSQPSDATPTKVTINVREPALAISASQLASRDSHASSLEDSRVPSNPSQGSSLRITGSPPQILTEMPSSPPQSPEIEVAELEDIDGHNGPTVWMAHESTTNFEDIQSALLQEFPFVEQYNNSLIHTIAAISGAMSAGIRNAAHMIYGHGLMVLKGLWVMVILSKILPCGLMTTCSKQNLLHHSGLICLPKRGNFGRNCQPSSMNLYEERGSHAFCTLMTYTRNMTDIWVLVANLTITS